jgi:type IV pilus assembly protein PilW
MKTYLSRRSPSRQAAKGLTLIEMMISIVIGMVIVVSIVALYAGSSGAARTAEAVGRMNEDGQAALTILSQQIRMAGSNPMQPNYVLSSPRNPVFALGSYPIRGCEGTFSNITVTTAINTLNCAAGTSTLPDSIAVSYEADRFNTVPTAAGIPTDCVGSSLTSVSNTVTTTNGVAVGTATVSSFLADNRFYIGTSTVITSPSLYCKGIGNINPQPMVENIEDLQFTYGTSPAATSTGTVAGYLDANGVETNAVPDTTATTLSALPTSATRWARVVTVHICVLARTEKPAAADAAGAKYIACNGNITTPPDLRLRRAYHTTVVLRNQQL